jgi:hypothetical protein
VPGGFYNNADSLWKITSVESAGIWDGQLQIRRISPIPVWLRVNVSRATAVPGAVSLKHKRVSPIVEALKSRKGPEERSLTTGPSFFT